MKLKNQVCSLEISKKPCELGVKQESLFYWKPGKGKHFCHQKKNKNHVHDYKWTICDAVKLEHNLPYYKILKDTDLIYSAFTVAELGEMLMIEKENDIIYYETSMQDMEIVLRTYDFDEELCEIAVTETDARAKMLIYLIENKLITL